MLPTLEVGSAKASNLLCELIRAGELDRLFGFPIDGILGYNFLRDLAVVFDFQKREIKLWPSGKLSMEEIARAGFGNDKRIPLVESGLCSTGVDARFDGKFTMTLGLDTGAFFTTIPEELARSLRLHTLGTTTVTTFDGTFSAGLGQAQELTIGGNRVPKPVLASLHGQPDFNGVLGCDTLSGYRVLVDFPGRAMYLHPIPVKRHHYTSRCPVLLPMVWCDDRHVPVIVAFLDGREPYRLGVDLSRSQTVLFHNPRENPARAASVGERFSRSPRSASTTVSVDLPLLDLPLLDVRRVPVQIAGDSPGKKDGPRGLDGIAGSDLLRNVGIVFNFQTGFMILRYGDTAQQLSHLRIRVLNWKAVPLILRAGRWYVVGLVDGFPREFRVDPLAVRTTLGMAPLLGHIHPIRQGSAADVGMGLIPVGQLRVGGVTWAHPPLLRSSVPGKEDVNVLGLDFLQRCHLMVDFHLRVIYLAPAHLTPSSNGM